MDLDKKQKVSAGFSRGQANHADINIIKKICGENEAIYIPTKEMISTVEHFVTLYEEYHIDFEEMYYDLAKLLDRPLSKGPNTNEQNQILSSLEDIMKVISCREKSFILKIKGEGEFEMDCFLMGTENYR